MAKLKFHVKAYSKGSGKVIYHVGDEYIGYTRVREDGSFYKSPSLNTFIHRHDIEKNKAPLQPL